MRYRLLGITLIALLWSGCQGMSVFGSSSEDENPSGSTSDPTQDPAQDPYAPCTDRERCCTDADIWCEGDPDGNPVCHCRTLWDCSKNPDKCQQPMEVPSGNGSWACKWTEDLYTCKGKIPSTSAPPGGTGWTCEHDAQSDEWTCTKSPPNPSNQPGGTAVWKCTVDNELDMVVCERERTPVNDGNGGAPIPPTSPPESNPPQGGHEQSCADGVDNDGDGKVDCMDEDCPSCTTGNCPPGQECCDGIDNNGDGRVDEGNVCGGWGAEPCPPGAYQACDCYCGVHRKCQPDGTWGPCIVDGNNSCEVAQITSHSQCPPFFACDYGQCVPNIPLFAQCKKHSDCPAGKVCDLGQCIEDIYHPCP